MISLDSFTQGYITCALWSSTDNNDEHLDANYGIEDIAPDTLAAMVADCDKFQRAMDDHITQDNLLRLPDRDWLGTYGHDYWLTRCGHGCGYWDGDYQEPSATALDNAAKASGSFDLYVGDDGRIYH
jgi:hypothetical protein